MPSTVAKPLCPQLPGTRKGEAASLPGALLHGLRSATQPQGAYSSENVSQQWVHLFVGEACWASGQFIRGGGERGGRGGGQLCFGSEWVTGPLGPRKAASRGSGKAVRRTPSLPCRGLSS